MSHLTSIVAVVSVSAEHAATVEQEFVRCTVASRQEEACKRYVVSRDLEKEGRFTAQEEWASREGFEEHLQTPHFRALARLLEKLGAKVDVLRVRPLDDITDAV
ncbi:putative quinol monooxygenase [Gluconobacter morbifer]|uniref:putative quinol monooxygenase n=1 Tax=Gluconobacter morbifer TaxID=479935 RepID=UPI00030AFFF1|nr:putative quinol monooxygenase [Gluconobacter morbifer]